MTKKKTEEQLKTSEPYGSGSPPAPQTPDEAEPTPANEENSTRATRHDFPIVGIGASAGGLAAIEALFSAMQMVASVVFSDVIFGAVKFKFSACYSVAVSADYGPDIKSVVYIAIRIYKISLLPVKYLCMKSFVGIVQLNGR